MRKKHLPLKHRKVQTKYRERLKNDKEGGTNLVSVSGTKKQSGLLPI